MRQETKNLQFYERVRGTENDPIPRTNESLCVKEFKKIDAIVGIEADQLRTMRTLQKTLDYLLVFIPFLSSFKFLLLFLVFPFFLSSNIF